MRDAATRTDMTKEQVPRMPTLSAGETGRLGREIYKRDIRHRVEPERVGEFVAIDVDSGCWALGESAMDARKRLEKQKPGAVNVLRERIGYEAVGSIGGGAPRRIDWSRE